MILQLDHSYSASSNAHQKFSTHSVVPRHRQHMRNLRSRLLQAEQIASAGRPQHQHGRDSVSSFLFAIGDSVQSLDGEEHSEVRSRSTSQIRPQLPSVPSIGQRKGLAHHFSSTGASKGSERDATLGEHRVEQEEIMRSLELLTYELKSAADTFSGHLQDERRHMDEAVRGLDGNADGLAHAGHKMGRLRKLSERRGWLGRMSLYAYIVLLWAVALVLMLLLPKLRI